MGLTIQLRNADAISADVFNELMKGQKLHASVDVQINHFASFDGDEKAVTKAMKKEVPKEAEKAAKLAAKEAKAALVRESGHQTSLTSGPSPSLSSPFRNP